MLAKTYAKMKRFSIIAAMTKSNRGIGYNNSIPWKGTDEGKADMRYFSKVTKDSIVIMGRKTWESIPIKFRPLPSRKNIIVSKSLCDAERYVSSGLHDDPARENYAQSLPNALNMCRKHNNDVFVIGGESLYNEAIAMKECEKIYLTEIDDTSLVSVNTSPVLWICDTFFPQIPWNFRLEHSNASPTLRFQIYTNQMDTASQEQRYLNLLQEILLRGETRSDRTGTGTKTVFGTQLRFDLTNAHGKPVLPLMTTKKTFFRGIVEELLFFLRGDHNNTKLQAKNVHIWDGNTSREYLDKYNKQHIQTGDLGLAYGVQWRAAGARLGNIDTDYRGQGIDQLAELLKAILLEPNSRRLIINAWNVPQLEDMALVPCHMLYQFDISANNKLNVMMTQRSADTFLGLPFNIASTALLVHILCKVNPHLTAGQMIISIGNAHIYNNHIEQVQEQLNRTPLFFPTIDVIKSFAATKSEGEHNALEFIENLEFKDFQLTNYYAHPAIKAEMAV